MNARWEPPRIVVSGGYEIREALYGAGFCYNGYWKEWHYSIYPVEQKTLEFCDLVDWLRELGAEIEAKLQERYDRSRIHYDEAVLRAAQLAREAALRKKKAQYEQALKAVEASRWAWKMALQKRCESELCGGATRFQYDAEDRARRYLEQAKTREKALEAELKNCAEEKLIWE